MSDLARPSEAQQTEARRPARPRRRRWLRITLGILLALLLLLPPLLIGGALLYASTEGGRDRLAGLVEGFVPGLRLEGLTGPLPGQLGIRRATLADAQGIWLEIDNARLDWDPRALFGRQVQVNLLAADRAALLRLPASDTPTDPNDPAGPLLPELPQLPVGVTLDRLEVARIELAPAVAGVAAVLRAEGMAALDAAGLTATLDLRAPEGATSLALRAALRPETGRLSADIVLRDAAGGPLPRLLGLEGRPLALDLKLDGPAEQAALTLTASAGPGLALDVSGMVRAPDMDRLGATLRGTADGSGLLEGPLAGLAGPLDLALEADTQPDGAIALRDLTVAGPPGRIAVQGSIAGDFASADLRVAAGLQGSESFAGLLPPGIAAWAGLDLSATVRGPLTTPTIDATLAARGFASDQHPVAALLGATPRITLRATAPDRIERFTLQGAAITAEAEGQVADTLDLRFAMDLASVAGAAPGLQGALRLTGTANGPIADPTLTLDASSERLEMAGQVLQALSLTARIANPATVPTVAAQAEGRFQGLPLALDLRGAPQPDGRLRLEAAMARLGPAEFRAEGVLDTATSVFDGTTSLNVTDLAPLSGLAGTPLAGSVRAEARLEGREGQQWSSLRLTAPRITASGTQITNLVGTLEGLVTSQAFSLEAIVTETALAARGQVTELQDGARRLELASFSAAGHGETIRLSAPARIVQRADGVVGIEQLALTSGRGGSFTLAGDWSAARADLRANLALPDLTALAPLLPAGAPAGRLTAEARITGAGTAPAIAASLNASQLHSNADWARGLPAVAIQAEATRAGDGAITARATATAGPATRLTVTANLPSGPDGPLEGALDGQADIGALTAPLLSAGADRVTGRMDLALRATGTLAAPQLGGQARLANGSYRNAQLGVALTRLGGTIAADGPRLRVNLTGQAGGQGNIALTGTVDPLGAGMPVDLALRAQNAQPVSSDLVRATMDADLTLTGDLAAAMRLGGVLRLRRADIRIPDRLPSSVRSLGDVTEIGRVPGRAVPARASAPTAAGAPPPPAPPIALDLRFEAPRGIFVRGRGLDAEMGGSLRIGGNVAAPDITGELSLVRGELQVLARRLSFSRGRLDFTGGLMPELDFEATSQTGGTTVRANVSGPPSQPRITFSSTPELPQDEVLARLLFDRPVSELSPFEMAQIAQAVAGATGLAGGGATGVLDRLRQGLGLDRLSVGGGGESAARGTAARQRSGPTLEAGSYVADGVYVGVRQGTESGSSRVGVRVDITPRIKVEAETGDREAGERLGLTYELQWGR